MNGIADHKTEARQAIHDRLAVSAIYERGSTRVEDTPELRFTVRWHNKIAHMGAIEGGFDATIIDGINRLVFNDPQLTALGLELRKGGRVTIPAWAASFELDSEEPMDGPLNRYWAVARVRD